MPSTDCLLLITFSGTGLALATISLIAVAYKRRKRGGYRNENFPGHQQKNQNTDVQDENEIGVAELKYPLNPQHNSIQAPSCIKIIKYTDSDEDADTDNAEGEGNGANTFSLGLSSLFVVIWATAAGLPLVFLILSSLGVSGKVKSSHVFLFHKNSMCPGSFRSSVLFKETAGKERENICC